MTSFLKYIILVLLSVAFLTACILGTTLSLPLQSLALIGLAGAGLLAAFYNFKSDRLPSPYLLLGVVLSLAYFGVRAYFSPVADFGMDDLFLILGAGLLYLIAGYACGSPAVRIAIAYSVLLALALHLGSAVMQMSGSEGFWPIQWFADVSYPRGSVITGMYGYRGSFANFVAVASMLSLSLAILGRYHSVLRVLLLLVSVIGFVGVSLSGSRSAIVALVFGGLVLAALLWMASAAQDARYKKYFRIMVISLGALFLIGGPYVVYDVFNKRTDIELEGSDVIFADSARGGYWPMALSQIPDHPWIGAGSRSFSYENYQHWNPNVKIASASPEFVHNEYLQVATDYGLLGLLSVSLIIGSHLVIGSRRVASITAKMKSHDISSSNELALCLAGIVGIVIMGVHSIFDFRTHLQANLLLATCCLLWVLPVRAKFESAKKAWFSKTLLSTVILMISVLTAFLGVKELKAGIPLLYEKLAYESNSWNVDDISEDDQISALEESITLSPSYRRHFKLATAYQQRSREESLSENTKRAFLEKSYSHYKQAEERHPYHPAIKVNLGSISGQLEKHSEAEDYFQEVLEMSGARGDLLFKTRIHWASSLYQKALNHWAASEPTLAEEAFQRAYQTLDTSEERQDRKRASYVRIASGHLKFLAATGDFPTGDLLIEKLTLRKTSPRSSLNYMGLAEYSYAKGMNLWYQRKPEEAMRCFLVAKSDYLRHKRGVKGNVDEQWQKGFDIVQARLDFFKKTNISPAPAKTK